MEAFLCSLRQFAPDPKGRTAMLRLVIAADGTVSRVELLRSSRVPSWDKEILEKAKAAKFSEAKQSGGLIIEPEIQPYFLVRGFEPTSNPAKSNAK
jgi:TonB family protein